MKPTLKVVLFAALCSAVPVNSAETVPVTCSDKAKDRALMTPEQVAAMQTMRQALEEEPLRPFKLPSTIKDQDLEGLLSGEGIFTDMMDLESEDFQNNLPKSDTKYQRQVAPRLELAFNRIWAIAEGFRGQPRPLTDEQQRLLARLYRAINHYGAMEVQRANNHGRFHASCFAMPLAAVNTYFSLLPEMDALEAVEPLDPAEASRARETLLAIGLQAWTVPARNDPTDSNPVSVDRFRNHVLWVGGNSIAYRPLLAVGLMYKSMPMINVVADVAAGAISATSFSTNHKSFWSEGMTADGSGWAHGRQNQPFTYPYDGIITALETLNEFKGTPWERTLTPDQLGSLLNYLRGSSWFYYKRFKPPVLDRQNMLYGSLGPADIRTKLIAAILLKDWNDQLDQAQIDELGGYATIAESMDNLPESVQPGHYRGVRYFWNQDALAVKSDGFYMLANMASKRSDGLESAASPPGGWSPSSDGGHTPASSWNFFTDDGHTLFCRDGLEYKDAIGAWNLTALPGVTARQGEDRLVAITNWRGFNSGHNFAGGVAKGDKGCAGFILEKQDAETPGDTAREVDPSAPNAIIHGIKAHKAYFVAGNSMLALGAGITNLTPETPGDIWTTINQASWRTPATARAANGLELKVGEPDGNGVIWNLLQKGDDAPPSISHDGFTYRVIPEFTDGQVKAIFERRDTKWNKLAITNQLRETPSEADIFQLWINHGANPQGARYAYLVTADAEASRDAKAQNAPLVVIANDEKMQAVRSPDGRLIQAVIYDPSAQLPVDNNGRSISVDTPCVLMIEKVENDRRWIVTASDPEQLAGKSAVHLTTDANIVGDSVTITPDGKSMIIIPLPEEPLLGKQATVSVSNNQGMPRAATTSVKQQSASATR